MSHDKPTRCCLCSQEAIGVFYLPQGCIAHPDLTVQPLCEHHHRRSQPLGGIERIKELRVGVINQEIRERLDWLEGMWERNKP